MLALQSLQMFLNGVPEGLKVRYKGLSRHVILYGGIRQGFLASRQLTSLLREFFQARQGSPDACLIPAGVQANFRLRKEVNSSLRQSLVRVRCGNIRRKTQGREKQEGGKRAVHEG